MHYIHKGLLVYLQETLGIQAAVNPIIKSNMERLPLYIHETFVLYQLQILGREIILAEMKNDESLSIHQAEKHVGQIRNLLNQKVVLLLANVQAFNRKRLIEKGINFIVPGKQLYIPDLLIDLRERFTHPKSEHKNKVLLPSAQFLLIYYISHRNQKWKLEEQPFKEIALKLGYTAMAITNAIFNLKSHELVEVKGEKEKSIRFLYERQELWNKVLQQNLFVNPVIRTVFVDELPKDVFMLHSNTSALPKYSDLNPSVQGYYAMEKTVFYSLQKNNILVNANDYEGRYALELWKYNPLKLAYQFSCTPEVVDPLSLYLSLRDSKDERIDMALDQILENFLW